MNDYDYLKHFLRHDECSVCGSSDNLSVYWNDELNSETWFCQTPGCSNRRTDADILKELKNMTYTKPTTLKTVELKARNISYKTCERYGVQVNPVGTPSYFFPYYSEGNKLIAGKFRLHGDKKFSWEGNAKDVTFFGANTKLLAKNLVITEGEFDALAASEILGKSYCCVSIPNGATSASKFVQKHLKWVEGFEKVYIVFDNDEPGNLAADEVYDLIKQGKAYRTRLRLKDANEYLLSEVPEDFLEDIEMSVKKEFQGIYSKETVTNWVQDEILRKRSTYEKLATTGINSLDSIFTFRTGEVTTIFSDPSVGKSSLVRWITSNLLIQGIKTLVFSLEETHQEWAVKTAGMVLGKNILGGCDDLFKDELEAFTSHIGEHLTMSTIHSTMTDDEFSDIIEYAVRQDGVQVVVVDNITAATSDEERSLVQRLSNLMGCITGLTKRYKLHTIVVSHTRRDKDSKSGEPPSMQSSYGSGHVERLSHNIISLGRDVANRSDVTNVRIWKQRATGVTGTFSINYDKETVTFYETEKERSDNTRRIDRWRNQERVRQLHRTDLPSEESTVTEDTEQIQNVRDISTDNDVTRLQTGGEIPDVPGDKRVPSEGVAPQNEILRNVYETYGKVGIRKSPGYCEPPNWSDYSPMVGKKQVRLDTTSERASSSINTEGMDRYSGGESESDVLRQPERSRIFGKRTVDNGQTSSSPRPRDNRPDRKKDFVHRGGSRGFGILHNTK